MFERGFYGHGGPLLYEPVIKIPLLISAPGQRKTSAVYTPSSNTDLLPTLLSIADREIPPVLDGQVLPEYGGVEDDTRPIFSLYAAQNSVFLPLKKAAISMRKGPYKLIAYFGYLDFDDVYEMYDLETDPEELQDLSQEDVGTFSKLKEELLDNLNRANKVYEQ
jgi:arylsulfatase A-like enzyme